jgi:hypothetical protein
MSELDVSSHKDDGGNGCNGAVCVHVSADKSLLSAMET